MRPSPDLWIRGGRIIDPLQGVDRLGDLAVVDGRIADRPAPGATVFDATDLIVCPGLTDIHVHLREPGGEHKEDIESGCAAAAAGGFTTVACMPNTTPAMDNARIVTRVLDRACQVGRCRVLPIAAITENRAGRHPTNFADLRSAGAVAFSDDGDGVEDDDVMRRALAQAKATGAVLIQHCEFKSLSAGGVMHAGPTAAALNLPGIDPRAEQAMIRRDIDLVRETSARYHVAHVSTAASVDLVRQAKAEGLPVTAEACPHHLLLTDQHCAGGDPNYKVNPPLRSAADAQACIEGLLDGTIDCLVTDHAPHTAEEKAVGFASAPFGVVGLETLVALMGTELVNTGRLDWPGLIGLLTRNPCSVLGLSAQGLRPGDVADLTVIDPTTEWTISPAAFAGRARNTPFAGRAATVRPATTILAGYVSHLQVGYEDRLNRRA
ncbi:MAG TPA: dihydroorotase [Phycisphaerae bacterium]|nr:dihydroorotase [Phycisphaerae bacterium]